MGEWDDMFERGEYAKPTVEQQIRDAVHAKQDAWRAASLNAEERWAEEIHARATAEAKVTRLREGLRALAGQRSVWYPEKFKPTPSENFVAGYRAAQADLRALLDNTDA